VKGKNAPGLFPILALVGPTAVGKTSLSIRLAREIHAEIINLDSVQLYRGLDIGSAKPGIEEQAGVAHHLLDIRQPCEPMDAASFSIVAARLADRILSRGRNVIFAGGTGFYLNALLEGFSEMPGRIPGLRRFLEDSSSLFGRKGLHGFLAQTDPETAARIHPNDIYRVTRALEVFLSSGRPFSWWCSRRRKSRSGLAIKRPVMKIGLVLPRPVLYERIDRRVDQMIEKGLVQEVKGLLEKGYHPELKPLQSLGYRHIISYLQGLKSLDEAVWEMKRDTRRYAKRQITWFRKDPQIRWYRPDELLSCENLWKALN